jgi:hypothetical protein
MYQNAAGPVNNPILKLLEKSEICSPPRDGSDEPGNFYGTKFAWTAPRTKTTLKIEAGLGRTRPKLAAR